MDVMTGTSFNELSEFMTFKSDISKYWNQSLYSKTKFTSEDSVYLNVGKLSIKKKYFLQRIN